MRTFSRAVTLEMPHLKSQPLCRVHVAPFLISLPKIELVDLAQEPRGALADGLPGVLEGVGEFLDGAVVDDSWLVGQ